MSGSGETVSHKKIRAVSKKQHADLKKKIATLVDKSAAQQAITLIGLVQELQKRGRKSRRKSRR